MLFLELLLILLLDRCHAIVASFAVEVHPHDLSQLEQSSNSNLAEALSLRKCDHGSVDGHVDNGQCGRTKRDSLKFDFLAATGILFGSGQHDCEEAIFQVFFEIFELFFSNNNSLFTFSQIHPLFISNNIPSHDKSFLEPTFVGPCRNVLGNLVACVSTTCVYFSYLLILRNWEV